MDDPTEPTLADLLPKGMDEDHFRAAVDLSGYPLQTVVAGSLADSRYRVEEEWAWLDQESESERTLDILAERPNGYSHRSRRGQVQAVASLLVECKQSRNPYLGFAAVSPPAIERHPRIIGLRPDIAIFSEDGSLEGLFPLQHVLGLHSHPYFQKPLVISSLSRAHPSGSKVKMSGEEPFNSLVRPLTKATRTFQSHWHKLPEHNRDSFVVRATFPVAVIDAPLFAVRGRRGSSDIQPVEWMRIFARHAAGADRPPRRPLGFDVVDLVAADFFDAFMKEYLDPFVEELALSLAKIQDCALDGKGRLQAHGRGERLPFNWRDSIQPIS